MNRLIKSMGFELIRENDAHPLVQFLVVILAIIVACVLSGWLISLTGGNPWLAFSELIRGAFGDKQKIYESLLRATPLILTGLATVIAFKAQIWSIGQEGQLFGGAMLAYQLYRVFQPTLDRPALISVVIIGGFLGGAFLGWLAAGMKIRFNVDIIISTVMLNYIVITLLNFLLYDHRFWMGTTTYYPRTDPIISSAWYPLLFENSRLHIGFLIAIGGSILLTWVLKRTPYGYDIRVLGFNPTAAKFKGIKINRIIMVTMLISGGLAGLAGAGEVFGVQHSLSTEISAGYGYMGIIIAVISDLNPLIVLPVAIIFGGFINGATVLVATTGTQSSIILVIQALILLSVLICRAMSKYRIRKISHVV
jgi:simple sugar transport system permease protein